MMTKIAKQLYKIFPFKKHLFGALKYVWQPPETVFRHLHFKDVFRVKVDENRSFRIHHFGYQLENELFWAGLTGGWEKVSMNLWLKLCGMSGHIIDIGANTGVYALAAKTVNPAAGVYAFEPVKRVYDKLRKNVAMNRLNIRCYELAVSDQDGKAIIYDTPGEHVYSVTVNKNLSSAGQRVIETEIQTITLASFMEQEQVQAIDLLKIDVETHEPEVLRGLGAYLEKMRPTMLVEILTDEVARQLQEILDGKGYLYFDIDEKNPPRLVTQLTRSSYYNFLICQPHVARQLQLLPSPSSFENAPRRNTAS